MTVVTKDDELAALRAELEQVRELSNRWAYKFSLLVLWVRQNCTTEQIAAAREFSSGGER